MNKCSLLIAATIFALPIYASAGAYQGKVTNVMASGGKVIITLQNGSSTDSTCGNGTRYYLDPSVDIDKVIISMAITAKISNKLVWVMGSGCISVWPYYNAEKVTDFDLKD